MTNPNDLAYPVTAPTHQKGLTKREYLAAMATIGLSQGKKIGDLLKGECVDVANGAVEIADALIQALNQPKQ